MGSLGQFMQSGFSTLGTLSIDNEIHDDDKEDWVEGFVLVVLRRRRVLVLRLVALAMAFKNVRNLLLILSQRWLYR